MDEMPAYESFDDLADLHLKQELVGYVREANCGMLPAVLGTVTRTDLRRAIAWVAALRGDYLKAVLVLARLESGHGDHAALEALSRKRVAYEEALAGVAALRHAIGQGYVDVARDGE